MSTPAKSKPKKKAAPSSHPPYNEMVLAAVKANAGWNPVSRQAIVKHIKANYKVSENSESHIIVACEATPIVAFKAAPIGHLLLIIVTSGKSTAITS